MIQVGDLVRVKNKHLRASFLGSFQGHNRRGRRYGTRGKQFIARVIRIRDDVAILDIPNRLGLDMPAMYNISYLVVHRKAKYNYKKHRADGLYGGPDGLWARFREPHKHGQG